MYKVPSLINILNEKKHKEKVVKLKRKDTIDKLMYEATKSKSIPDKILYPAEPKILLVKSRLKRYGIFKEYF